MGACREALLGQFGSVAEFMMAAQECCESGDYTLLEETKINNRKLGKSAQKMFETEGIWAYFVTIAIFLASITASSSVFWHRSKMPIHLQLPH